TCLVTMDLSRAGSMPCNPSVGGPAKGIVVREIDALGGVMPRAADATALQFKMLNTSKGPGVQCLRVQSDKLAYSRWMAAFLKQQPHLTVVENRVESLDIEEGAVRGAICRDGTRLCARTVVVTSGTYMQSVVLKGHTATPSGPDGQPASEGLSESLRNAGLHTFRLKTGTPPRVLADSVDLSFGQEQTGSAEFLHFSDDTRPEDVLRPDEQESCTLIWTRPETHRIIREHLTDSAMYSGLVRGKGPRYCPSIEDKLVRFADKERHQLFLEPESRDLDTLYIQGFSTSMPEDVQEQMVHSLPGLEHAVIEKYAYAIEYDAIDPLQLRPSLETRAVSGLFTAGQVNGTSGYEEAAGQGLMAGINAVLKVQPPFVLRRDEAYIGVMIDDLVTKGTQEPYRLLTSRAEYRLLLRHDNAADRLSRKGYSLGLISRDRMERALISLGPEEAESERLKQELEDLHIPPATAHPVLDRLHLDPLRQGASGLDLLKRPNVTTEDLIGPVSDREAAAALEIAVKYEGYIAKARRDADRLAAMEARQIPDDLDYGAIGNLSLEARQKLSAVRPETLGQASRISGVNPADIAVLAVSLAPVEKGDSK
ncbi:tRNA uridine-5-carboxymethylaminomethyl(34) synthesis enzyme MnmG, partial [Faecalibaculum rodentium]|uniref:tRNA uridine-5-carboxymethylaminomethyl(34) synthesis enzyme MnmG n=1 Tax=Faecalibaculum rodentium TaxID=1702221 RepID=UPI0025AA1DBC